MDRKQFLHKSALAIGGSAVITSMPLAKATPYLGINHSMKGMKIGMRTESDPNQLHPTNNYWIETSDGVFVIDAQWTLSGAKTAYNKLREQTSKPILGMLITHDHNDHYGGIKVYKEDNNFPVYASALVKSSIANDAMGFHNVIRKAYKDNFPAKVIAPEKAVKNGEKMKFGEVEVTFVERTANEAMSTMMLAVESEGVLFTGDFVSNMYFALLFEGIISATNWLHQLENAKSEFGDYTFYPGHGEPIKGKKVIKPQIDFISSICDLVFAQVNKEGKITDSSKKMIREKMLASFPKHKPVIGVSREQLMDQSIDWLAKDIDNIVENPPEG